MLATVKSVAHVGLESVGIEVEVDVAKKGFPGFSIVGLPNKAVEEARERVKTALINTGCEFPRKKITVNLAPADLAKEGSCYDLPIAVGILVASEQIPWGSKDKEALYYGELSLDGSLRHTRGVLLVGIFAKKRRIEKVLVPIASSQEAAVVEKIKVMPIRSLKQLIMYLKGEKRIKPLKNIKVKDLVENAEAEFDFNEVVGQEQAKRALMIACGGGHNILMSGPPGSGKTMLARALPGILPPLTGNEALEVTQVYSATGLMKPGEAILRIRPFRNPHHSTSMVGLIGGGSRPKPGEVSLAHLGVMFLDEMAEFPRGVLEAMRQPMEDGSVVISRAAGRMEFPSNFMLVAAVNPCACGFLGHPKKECKCSIRQISRYKRRISGPILDRIDLHINVPAVEAEELSVSTAEQDVATGESSKQIREKIINTRKIQEKRFSKNGIYTNAQMKNKLVKIHCELDKETLRLMKLAVDKHNLSARSYFRLLKVSRTIADLAESSLIKFEYVAEALQYRMRVF